MQGSGKSGLEGADARGGRDESIVGDARLRRNSVLRSGASSLRARWSTAAG